MPPVPPVSEPDAAGVEAVDRLFDAATGPLASAWAGFEDRPGQRRLARAVAATFTRGGVLVAEAGTGIGKTLAYLVPAMLAGRQVLVSTGTRTLQDQVFYKDVPALARALGRSVRAAYMKGRTNYLCRHRFGHLGDAAAALPHQERRWLDRLSEWAAETATGDRAEVEDLPDDLPFWGEVTATSEQCLGRDCPEYTDCFITRMRDRAAEAELVIVNHHLLCADASVREGNFGEVIPACDLLVVDEAHQLEDVVTQYFGVSLSAHRMDELARDGAHAASALPGERGRSAVEIAQAASAVQTAARRFFELVRTVASERDGGDRVRLTAEMARRLAEPGEFLGESVAHLQSALSREQGFREDVDALAGRAGTIREDLDMLLSAADPRFVHFVEQRGRGILLRAAPIDASSIIRESIVGTRHATVFTSATLAVEGAFEYSLTRLGAPDAETLQVPSEFDYARQAMLYLPPDMPDPRSRDFNAAAAEVIAALLARTRGRAFVLFTSYAAMRDVHARLASTIGWPLLLQGTAPRPALLREFRTTPHAVLLATSSFWQGIDVAGEALSCVIIDRLPFASPGDPLVAARIAAVEARGAHPFHEYQVPLATLTLLQGLGRLIRTRTDRGVMAVLDPRLTRMGYGRRFLASLPPAPLTDDLAAIDRFLSGSSDGPEAVRQV